MKSNKEIIDQYLPDGGYAGLNQYNENKVLRMIEQAIKTDKLKDGRFTVDDMVLFAKAHGATCNENDLNHWVNEAKY